MRNQLLGNRYRILDRIGEGGMAYVYVAVDEKLGRKVAIKVLHEHMEKNPDIRKRFQLEAQAVSSLEHPNIVKIYDYSGDGSERLWIVTEVIRGKNLAQYVQQFTGGWLHPVIASCVVREICRALERAHAQAIVHRDIKPENVMLTTEGRVKLMDFGIAKDLAKSSMTLTGTFMGSPSYMSPEQIRGRDVDLRSDLYSLSVLFYEIVTGRLPFTGQTTHDVVMKIMEGGFTHPRYIVPSLPDRLNDLIVRGMAKEPEARFQSARDYGTEIEQLLKQLGFDESHVELERYFKDRQAYEERLARKTKAVMAQSNTLSQKLRRDSVVTLREPQPSLKRQPTLPPPPAKVRTSPFQAEEAWQKHMPKNEPSVVRQPVPPPPHRTETGHRTEAPRHASQRTRHPTQAIAQSHMAQQLPVQPVVDVSSVKRQAGLPPRPRPKHYRPRVARPQRVTAYRQSSWLSYVFGVALIGVLGVVSLWGFWELQTRLAQHENAHRPTATATTPAGKNAPATNERPRVAHKPPKKRNGTPAVVRTVEHKPSVAAPATLPAWKKPQNKLVVAPKTAAKKPPRKQDVKRPEVKPEVTVIANEPSQDPGLTVETVELKRPKRPIVVVADGETGNEAAAAKPEKQEKQEKQAKTEKAAKPAKSDDGADAHDEKTEKAEKPAPSGKGKLLVSSQPAAEIFVDGRRLGTTVDNTSDSGWLPLAAGKHTLELRRQGYGSYRTRFDLAGDEQKSFPRVVLEQASQQGGNAAAASTVLTLRVSAFPAQVTIRNLDSSVTQVFTMKGASKAVPLTGGRYHVRIERNGDVKERDLTLGGGQLTFSADFKDEE